MRKAIVLCAIGFVLHACTPSLPLLRGQGSPSLHPPMRKPAQQIVELPLLVEQNYDNITVRGEGGGDVTWFQDFFQGFYTAFATAWATLCAQPRCLPLPWTVTVTEAQAKTAVVVYGARIIRGQLPEEIMVGQREYKVRDTASAQSAAQRAARQTAESLLAVGPRYGFR